uniref:Uncharacterized protein n=1 Tax=Panagrolaimus sp. PS1159 TaxID=55785 RepID=A0AC35GRM6_9BILA
MAIGLGICSETSPDCSELYPAIFIIFIIIVTLIICCPWFIFACSDKEAKDSIKETVGAWKTKSQNAIRQSKTFGKYYVKKQPPTSVQNNQNFAESKVMISINDDVFDV